MNKNLLVREAKSVYDWARRINKSDDELGCWCAICSYELFKRLRRQKLNPTFYKVDDDGFGHCFVDCMGYIVDVTARQFTPDVNFIEVRKTNDDGHWFWSRGEQNFVNVETSKSTTRIKKILEGFPREQNPFRVNLKEDWA